MKIVKMKRVIPKPKESMLKHVKLGKPFLYDRKVFMKVEGRLIKGKMCPCVDLANGQMKSIFYYEWVTIPFDVVLQVKLT